jgi:hypothetical protein
MEAIRQPYLNRAPTTTATTTATAKNIKTIQLILMGSSMLIIPHDLDTIFRFRNRPNERRKEMKKRRKFLVYRAPGSVLFPSRHIFARRGGST